METQPSSTAELSGTAGAASDAGYGDQGPIALAEDGSLDEDDHIIRSAN